MLNSKMELEHDPILIQSKRELMQRSQFNKTVEDDTPYIEVVLNPNLEMTEAQDIFTLWNVMALGIEILNLVNDEIMG